MRSCEITWLEEPNIRRILRGVNTTLRNRDGTWDLGCIQAAAHQMLNDMNRDEPELVRFIFSLVWLGRLMTAIRPVGVRAGFCSGSDSALSTVNSFSQGDLEGGASVVHNYLFLQMLRLLPPSQLEVMRQYNIFSYLIGEDLLLNLCVSFAVGTEIGRLTVVSIGKAGGDMRSTKYLIFFPCPHKTGKQSMRHPDISPDEKENIKAAMADFKYSPRDAWGSYGDVMEGGQVQFHSSLSFKGRLLAFVMHSGFTAVEPLNDIATGLQQYQDNPSFGFSILLELEREMAARCFCYISQNAGLYFRIPRVRYEAENLSDLFDMVALPNARQLLEEILGKWKMDEIQEMIRRNSALSPRGQISATQAYLSGQRDAAESSTTQLLSKIYDLVERWQLRDSWRPRKQATSKRADEILCWVRISRTCPRTERFVLHIIKAISVRESSWPYLSRINLNARKANKLMNTINGLIMAHEKQNEKRIKTAAVALQEDCGDVEPAKDVGSFEKRAESATLKDGRYGRFFSDRQGACICVCAAVVVTVAYCALSLRQSSDSN